MKGKTFDGRWLALAGLVLLIDQVIKALAQGVHVQVIPGFFALDHTINTGASFSLLAGNNALLTFISACIILAIGYAAVTSEMHASQRLLLWLIIGAATSNLLDRIVHGGVTDYLHVSHFPVFNLADSVITVCVVLLAITMLTDMRLGTKKE